MLLQSKFMQNDDISLDLSSLTSVEVDQNSASQLTQEKQATNELAQGLEQTNTEKNNNKAVIVNDSAIEGSIIFSNNLQNSDEEIHLEIPLVEIEEKKSPQEDKSDLIVEISEMPVPEILQTDLAWQTLDNGLDYINRKEKFFLEKLILDVDVHILRVDINNFDIDLYGSFLDDAEGKSVRSWALEKKLQVAINASMYLPDNKTSNGYMRSGSHINNGQLMERMSGFFFTKPKKEGIAQCLIAENLNKSDKKSKELFDSLLDSYEVAIQNFRILGNYREDIKESELLWEQDVNKFSIAAYGDDIDGNFYLIFSRAPLSVFEFGNYILSLSSEGLHLKNLLYAEGGSEAGLFLETRENQYFIAGIVRNTPFSNIAMAVPNVLGIKKKAQ